MTADSSRVVSGQTSAWWATDKGKTPTKILRSEPLYAKTVEDTKNSLITGLDVIEDGNMVVADRNNSKLKVFSQDGKFISSLLLPEKPTDVAAINEKELAVGMWFQRIAIVDISDIHKLSIKNIIKLDFNVWAITSYQNNLILTCGTEPRCVKMLDFHGKVQWSTATSSDGTVLFDSPYFITTSSTESHKVIITDEDRLTITILDARSGNLEQVVDVESGEPRGVTTDEHDNMYLCYETGEISVRSKDMKEERFIADRAEGLKKPCAVVFNCKRGELLMSSSFNDSNYTDFIHRYHLT